MKTATVAAQLMRLVEAAQRQSRRRVAELRLRERVRAKAARDAQTAKQRERVRSPALSLALSLYHSCRVTGITAVRLESHFRARARALKTVQWKLESATILTQPGIILLAHTQTDRAGFDALQANEYQTVVCSNCN